MEVTHMAAELDPIVGNWYEHLDKGQRFEVVAVDEDNGTVETQDFDGNLNEFDIEEWHTLDIQVCEEPENWSGPMDMGERDDYGTEVTDTSDDDFDEPYQEYREEEE
jgi:hypothetical protein